MSAAFTPGPWRATATYCHDRDGWPVRAGGYNVAIASYLGGTSQAQANARLIAAAPELYEAVRLFAEVYDAGDEADGVALMLAYNNALTAAKDALAKARGDS